MRNKLILLTIVLLPAISLNSCNRETLSRDDVIQTLDSLEHKLTWIDYRLRLEHWQHYTTGTADSLTFFEDLYNQVVSDPAALNRMHNGRRVLTDELDLRRFDLIYGDMMVGRIESDRAISRLRDSLSLLDINYRAAFEGEYRSSSELYQLYRTDPKPQRREVAYRAWCSVGLQLADGLQRLIRLRNQTASRLGYTNFLSVVFKQLGIDAQEYNQLLEHLDSLSANPYRLILDEHRTRLGLAEMEIWDIAFADAALMKQVDAYFPADSQMEYIGNSFKGIGFDLDSLPIYFDLQPREGKSQFAYAFPIKPPHDQRVLANLVDGIYSAEVLLHEIGHTLEAVGFAQDRQLFAWSVRPAWTEGTAQIFAALVTDSLWLAKYAHLPPELITTYKAARQRQDVIYLRSQLVRLHFEFEAYSDPNRDLNQLYWDLVDRYMFVPRHEDIKPWAAVIHYTTHPVYLQNYLYADLIASQSLAYLYDRYDHIVDNPSFKSFLNQNYFRFGSRYPWQELLERGTGKKLLSLYYERRLGI